MKYFTAELHVRLQDADPGCMDAADAEWERALASYHDRLESIQCKLPPSAREFLNQTRLHDAEVLWMGQALPLFIVLLRLDAPSAATMGLSYFVVRDVCFERQVVPQEFRGSRMLWMYDEFDLGEQDGTFRHSALFSDGSQLELEAREVHVATLDTVYAQFDSARLAASA
jgi:hypothetical protein